MRLSPKADIMSRRVKEGVAVELQIADAPINSGTAASIIWPTRAIVCLTRVTHIYRRLGGGTRNRLRRVLAIRAGGEA